MEFPIARADIDAVIHCQENAAIFLLTKLYTILTGKAYVFTCILM